MVLLTPEERLSLLPRLARKSRILDNGCWEYSGYSNHLGYGIICVGPEDNCKRLLAHRVAFELHNGEIPEGKILDHICHDPKTCAGGKSCPHRRCVNPEHLKACSRAENCSNDRAVWNGHESQKLATEAAAKWKRERTHCPNGHAFAGNVYIGKEGYRRCRTCTLNRQKLKYHGVRAA